MLAADVDLELLQLDTTKLGVGHHALDGLLHDEPGAGGQQLAVGGGGEAAGVAGVAVCFLQNGQYFFNSTRSGSFFLFLTVL